MRTNNSFQGVGADKGAVFNALSERSMLAGGSSLALAFVVSGCALISRAEPVPALEQRDLSVHTGPHRVGLLDTGWEALAVRIHLIRTAQRSIDLQTYIWSDDDVGRLMAHEMIRAARRGVKVRLLIDKMFADSEREESLVASLATVAPDLSLKHYNPCVDQVSVSSLAFFTEVVFNFDGVNQRAHDKLMVVDENVALLGGRNIANEYFDCAEGMNFRDREVIVQGPVVEDMVRSFERFWAYERSVPSADLRDVRQLIRSGSFPRLETAEEFEIADLLGEIDSTVMSPETVDVLDGLQIVHAVAFCSDPPGKRSDFVACAEDGLPPNRVTPTLAGLIRGADESVLIQTPYLVLSDQAIASFEALRSEHPEVSVRVSTNSLAASDGWEAYSGTCRQKRLLIEELGFLVFELKPRPADVGRYIGRHDQLAARTGTRPTLSIHSKSLVLDGELACIGSHNLDPRSEHLNTELMLLVWDEEFAGRFERSIEADIDPRNSWTVWKRERAIGLRQVEELTEGFNRLIAALTTIDLWPSRYASNFELIEGGEAVPPGHPDFYENYRPVGQFPKVSPIEQKLLLTHVFKTVGGVATPLL